MFNSIKVRKQVFSEDTEDIHLVNRIYSIVYVGVLDDVSWAPGVKRNTITGGIN